MAEVNSNIAVAENWKACLSVADSTLFLIKGGISPLPFLRSQVYEVAILRFSPNIFVWSR